MNPGFETSRKNTSTPRAKELIQFFGSGPSYEGTYTTTDEYRALQRVYGFHDETLPEIREPTKPDTSRMTYSQKEYALKQYEEALAASRSPKNREEIQSFLQAGSDLALMRHARNDGLRMIFWLSRYLEPGQDPVKLLISMAVASGFDVDPGDVDYMNSEEEEEL